MMSLHSTHHRNVRRLIVRHLAGWGISLVIGVCIAFATKAVRADELPVETFMQNPCGEGCIISLDTTEENGFYVIPDTPQTASEWWTHVKGILPPKEARKPFGCPAGVHYAIVSGWLVKRFECFASWGNFVAWLEEQNRHRRQNEALVAEVKEVSFNIDDLCVDAIRGYGTQHKNIISWEQDGFEQSIAMMDAVRRLDVRAFTDATVGVFLSFGFVGAEQQRLENTVRFLKDFDCTVG